MSEPFVRPVKVRSPYTGDYCNPRIRESADKTYRIKEAIWICPTTGEFFKRGIVSREPINPPSNESSS